MKGEKKKMALMIKLGTLYVGDEPLEFRSGPRKYDYRHTPSIEICDTVPGKEIKWIDTGQGLYISKIPLLNYISWNDLEQNGFTDGKVVIVANTVAICRLLRCVDKPGVQNEWKEILDSVSDPPGIWGPQNVGFWTQEHGEGWGGRVAGEQGIRTWSPVGRNVRDKDIGFRPALELAVRNQDICEEMIGKGLMIKWASGTPVDYWVSGKLVEFTDYDLLLEDADGSIGISDNQLSQFLPNGRAFVSRAALGATTEKL